MTQNNTNIISEAIAIQTEYLDFRNRNGWDNTSDQRSPAEKERAKIALEKFRLIGSTAAFFGGYTAMLALNDAIVAGGGDSKWVNQMWDGIADWVS